MGWFDVLKKKKKSPRQKAIERAKKKGLKGINQSQRLKKDPKKSHHVMAFENNKDEIKLCEVKYANTYLTVHKDSWSSSLTRALDFYIEKEEYEECIKIKELIDKL